MRLVLLVRTPTKTRNHVTYGGSRPQKQRGIYKTGIHDINVVPMLEIILGSGLVGRMCGCAVDKCVLEMMPRPVARRTSSCRSPDVVEMMHLNLVLSLAGRRSRRRSSMPDVARCQNRPRSAIIYF